MSGDYFGFIGSFSIFAVPAMAVLTFIYCFCTQRGVGKKAILAKCAGSGVSLLAAGVFTGCAGGNPFSSLLFWGLLLCVAADALLDVHFISGMAVFAAAHVLFIIRLFSMGALHWAVLPIWVAAFLLSLLAFKKEFAALKKFKFMFYLYPLVLSAMASLAVVLPFTKGVWLWPTAAGAVLFVFSDFLVGKSFFGKKRAYTGVIIMTAYYAALYLLALNAHVY